MRGAARERGRERKRKERAWAHASGVKLGLKPEGDSHCSDHRATLFLSLGRCSGLDYTSSKKHCILLQRLQQPSCQSSWSVILQMTEENINIRGKKRCSLTWAGTLALEQQVHLLLAPGLLQLTLAGVCVPIRAAHLQVFTERLTRRD